MLLIAFFSWWYGRGWREIAQSVGSRIDSVAYLFSVQQLLRTLFAPWRRIVTYPGSSLGERIRAWGDNVVSRAVGFVVRMMVLLAAVVALVIVSLFTLIEIIVWPLLPIASVVLIIVGLV